MRKRLITIFAAAAVSMSLGMTAYALPAQAGPEAPALTIRDIPETQSPNPGPFPTRATLDDLEEFEAPQDTEDAENPGESWPPESDAAEEPGESEEIGEPAESGDPENPADPNTPADPENPADPNAPADPENPADPNAPADPENPADPSTPEEPETPAEDGTLSADVAAIRESLGVLIETNQPFFADAEEKQYFFDNIAAIRRDLDILVYAVIPVAAAVFLIWKFCLWFYRTFVESALG